MKGVRISVRSFILLLPVLLSTACTGGGHPLEGRPAPSFELKDLAGETVRLSDLAGRVLVLEFWAPWCGHCRENIPVMKRLHDDLEKDGVTVLGISLEQGPKTVGEFVARHGMNYRILFADRKMLHDYHVSAIPVTVVIDRRGTIRCWHAGAVSHEDIRKCMERSRS